MELILGLAVGALAPGPLRFPIIWALKKVGVVQKGDQLIQVAIDDIREWPRVFHYLSDHEGRSIDCEQCKTVPPSDAVDTIR